MVSTRLSASVTVATAVSKPKLRSQPAMSLSMVLGTPTIGTPPTSPSRAAIVIVPSPPMVTSASSPARAGTTTSAETSRPRQQTGWRVLLVPRMVPLVARMPLTSSQPSGHPALDQAERKPSSMPITSAPHWRISDL